ncbi:ATP-dependent RNA helicase dbp6 [Geopyxis carbonaria]|nr:ATP-dependent RNA helicase dbp6 [Geopyxis carbonaria]
MEEAPKVDTQVTETKNSSSKSAKLNAPVDVSSEPEAGTGHSRILQKLRKSLARSAAVAKAAPEPAEGSSLPQGEQVAPVGLQSLPQPAPVTESKPISAFSSLPLWLQKPVTVAPTAKAPFSEIESLSPKLIEKLLSRDITEAFAVQSAVLPILLRKADGDVCISAATGSGKTLAYVLPVIQSLLNRCVIRLRAIIVVPTRELVQQVNNTATSLISGTGLKIGVASGSKALSIEQAMLISNEDGETNSKVDILITTPGRLVEHVRSTPGFDLAHVKWLVIDEADRLLAQSFQEWVDVVIGGLEKAAERVMITQVGGMNLSDIGLTPMRHYTRKVVLSATMTRDVGKLAELRLRRPTLVVVEDPPLPDGAILDDGKAENELEEQFSVPAGLREHVIPVENIELKPLCLMYLLQNKGIKTGALVFVKSNEGAARLAKLLETVGEKSTNKWNVGLVTGEMEKKRREKVLKRFAKGEVDLLICSDLISRGLDLPHVRHIVNYDIPASTRAYIHRVGRTARAGKEGDAWTLLSDKEARWFWGNIGKNIRRSTALAKVSVDVEMEGYGLRGIYESVLYGAR